MHVFFFKDLLVLRKHLPTNLHLFYSEHAVQSELVDRFKYEYFYMKISIHLNECVYSMPETIFISVLLVYY